MVARWRGKFANCTYVIVSLLKAWKVTGRDRVRRCRLLTPYQEGTHQKLFSQAKNINSSSKVANWIIVDILKYFN